MSRDPQIIQLWQQVEDWLAVHAPEIAHQLYPGASEDEIAKAEKYLGVTFHNDFRTFYSIHNGQPRGQGMFDSWSLRSLESVVSKWQSMKEHYDLGIFNTFPTEQNGRVREAWWHPGWTSLLITGVAVVIVSISRLLMMAGLDRFFASGMMRRNGSD